MEILKGMPEDAHVRLNILQSDSLWIHGEYRIEFNNKLLCHAKLNKWDYRRVCFRFITILQ